MPGTEMMQNILLAFCSSVLVMRCLAVTIWFVAIAPQHLPNFLGSCLPQHKNERLLH